jgi:hypothetical protein
MLAAAILRSHDTPFIHDDYLQEGKAGMSPFSTLITSLPPIQSLPIAKTAI